jgi:uncharacterized protein YidB (DUF937 family)
LTTQDSAPGSRYTAAVDEQGLATVAGELGMDVEQLREAMVDTTPGVVDALAGGMIRFEDALLELSG